MKDLNAMVRQLGNPTFFASFSAADRQWKEIVQCICSQLGKPYDPNMDWATYCDLINENVVTATRMFHHRVNAFIAEVILAPYDVIGKVVDYFHRVEFQSRGWPHLHCLIWVEGAPQFGRDSDEAVAAFIDQHISVRCHVQTPTLNCMNKSPRFRRIHQGIPKVVRRVGSLVHVATTSHVCHLC